MGKITQSDDGSLGALLARVEKLERQLRTVANSSNPIIDGAGNRLVSPASSGSGLSRPYVPIPFYEPGETTVPTATTTGTAYVALQAARYIRQHPGLRVIVLCRSSAADTTGTIRIAVTDVAGTVGGMYGTTESLAGSDYKVVEFGLNVPDLFAYGELVKVEIRGRRTAGTGTIGARVLGAYGIDMI